MDKNFPFFSQRTSTSNRRRLPSNGCWLPRVRRQIVSLKEGPRPQVGAFLTPMDKFLVNFHGNATAIDPLLVPTHWCADAAYEYRRHLRLTVAEYVKHQPLAQHDCFIWLGIPCHTFTLHPRELQRFNVIGISTIHLTYEQVWRCAGRRSPFAGLH